MNKGQIVLITGANSGMGKATALELAKTGARIVMLCRSKQRGEAALEEVKAGSGSPDIDLMLCDLASLQEIRAFCKTFSERYQRLDVLVNNAGVILPGRQVTRDGWEMQFGVNHLGHFLLTNLLLDLMKKSAPSRIVNVSSGAHKIGKIFFTDVNLTDNYSVWRAYAQSKLANILFTYELARRLDGTGVTVNCLHPGAVATEMGISRETGFGRLITSLLKPFFQTPRQGADTAIYLAESPEVQRVTAQYFFRKKPVSSSRTSYDRETALRLWELSCRLTGMKGSEKQEVLI
jgi:NAD(P)-dependent dehydrogenase (short-subunit alcohol dehydrogenase family)